MLGFFCGAVYDTIFACVRMVRYFRGNGRLGKLTREQKRVIKIYIHALINKKSLSLSRRPELCRLTVLAAQTHPHIAFVDLSKYQASAYDSRSGRTDRPTDQQTFTGEVSLFFFARYFSVI